MESPQPFPSGRALYDAGETRVLAILWRNPETFLQLFRLRFSTPVLGFRVGVGLNAQWEEAVRRSHLLFRTGRRKEREEGYYTQILVPAGNTLQILLSFKTTSDLQIDWRIG